MANEFIARNGLISQNNSVVTGSLTVTQGITGSLFGTASFASTASFVSIPTFTNGSVLFSSGSTLAQDNANLFWDNTNDRLGIGTNTPADRLHISQTVAGNNNILRMSSAAGNANVITFRNADASIQGAFLAVGSTFSYGTYLSNQCNLVGGSGGLGFRVTNAANINLYGGNADADFGVNYFRLFGATGNVLIQNGGTFTDNGFRLDVNGTTRLNGNTTITGSLNITGSSTLRGTVNITPTTSTANSLVVTGPTLLSGSQNTISGSVLTVVGSGSAQPVFTVQGSQGELFSITDSLSGSLFSVNDISGLPIVEVFSDGTTLMGNYLDPMLVTTAKNVLTNSGAFTIYSLPTASYDTAFFDYSVRSGSNARAGQIMAIQSASVVNYTETTTMDFGSTSGISLGVFISGSNMVLTGSAATSAWTIKTIIRSL